MASAGTSRAEKTARRLFEITDAAAKVFARRGYHGASTQDIADVLGIRQASLYYYFESKEAALEAVCRYGHEGYVERLDSIARSEASASEKVAQVLSHHAAPGRLDFTLVFLRERRFLPGPARKRIRALEQAYERAIQRIVQQGIGSGEFRRDLDARVATLALLGLGNSAALWIASEPHAAAEETTHAYAEMLVRAFRAGH
jgi:TetR/AcrR family transcriptional regulator, cholesterol catabolism regulator